MSEGNYKAGNAHIVCVRTRNPWYNMYTTMQAGVRMSSELNISERFVNELVNYCSSNHGISQVILFGSRARGDFHPNSDIDLAIRTKNTSHSEQNIMEDRIQEMSTHLKLDIVFMNRLTKKDLISNINQEGVIIYEKGKALREA
ncbi:nucleotidyltransferase family protein [Lentibacillus juripiscarius]|uniref:Nucleotidyltransferase family protein n=1 Tax=Lentibacillus juripiscarius TaxID=257446 RepID=A0ABW5V5J6_9BACI